MKTATLSRSRSQLTYILSVGCIYLLMTLMGSYVTACEQENGVFMLDPRLNVDKPVRAIADSDPLYQCVESDDKARNSSMSSTCDPKDGVLLPDADPEKVEPR